MERARAVYLARYKLTVSLLPGDFPRRRTWSRRPSLWRLKLLAAEDVAHPRSRRGPVSRAKRVYALISFLFLGVVVFVFVFVVGVMTEMTLEGARKGANEKMSPLFLTLHSRIFRNG